MPRATNERLAASRAIGGLALIVKDVAHIAVLDTRGERDLPRALQRCRGSSWLVRHSEIWMERREVKRHAVPQIGYNPVAKLPCLVRRIILTGYHQIGNLEPDLSFSLKPSECIQHRVQM